MKLYIIVFYNNYALSALLFVCKVVHINGLKSRIKKNQSMCRYEIYLQGYIDLLHRGSYIHHLQYYK